MKWPIVTAFAAVALLSSCTSVKPLPGEASKGRGSAKEAISIVINSNNFSFPDGYNENRNPYLQFIEDHTDLDVEVLLPPVIGYQKTANSFLNAEKLPDMISIPSKILVAKHARQNALMPLDELLDLYGANLKANIPESVWEQARFNGHLYAIPSMSETQGMELMYVRKDWLDKLGLQPPATLEEYERVIRAFAEEDPDGNGKADTFGLSMVNNLFRSAPFFGAFGLQLDQWVERDGKLVYSHILPEMKEALLFLSRLYKEQLIDQDFPLNTHSTLAEKIKRGQVGLFSATWYDTRTMIAENKRFDPAAEWIPLEYPIGPSGKKGVYATKRVQSYQVIPASSKHGEAVIRFLNFIAGKGKQDLVLGFEHQVWKRIDDKIVSDFAEHDKHLYRGMYSSLAWIDDPNLLRIRLDSYGKEFRLFENLQLIQRNLIHDQFTGLPTPTMEESFVELNELNGIFMKIVIGAAPPEDFDLYVKQWKEGGGDVITQEVNDWYQSSQK
ncbi:extracellular solute-binding protein [Paenibacillus sp. SYP-B3998]|uniref:Extracellular solute-binding protein n=1 Tax=Paenibacillus sp. SYP-B3998 TaxID=2678564 RepID=A0A6G3ZUJ9_9BACL|nr:extracellular solute-binding protein [Paenibacillus sp. SYP-B3998]NEW05795.1 extracellular solute-binding protein [Paenibacillus sp. SYP-B3998]